MDTRTHRYHRHHSCYQRLCNQPSHRYVFCGTIGHCLYLHDLLQCLMRHECKVQQICSESSHLQIPVSGLGTYCKYSSTACPCYFGCLRCTYNMACSCSTSCQKICCDIDNIRSGRCRCQCSELGTFTHMHTRTECTDNA